MPATRDMRTVLIFEEGGTGCVMHRKLLRSAQAEKCRDHYMDALARNSQGKRNFSLQRLYLRCNSMLPAIVSPNVTNSRMNAKAAPNGQFVVRTNWS